MGVKLFVSDIDGTLLLPNHKISARNIDAVKRMTDAGITVTIATGRMYRASLPVALELGVNVPIITYNGALIKSVDGEIIYENCLPENIVVALVEFYQKRGWHLQGYSEDTLYVALFNSHVKDYEISQKVKANVIGWDGMKEKTFRVYKMLSIAETEEENLKRIAELKAEFGNKIDVTKSTPIFTEIICPGVSKAAAVKTLAAKLGIPREEVMAIGDSDNDLLMLKAAGTSIAMGNGTEEVKNSCDFITGLCEDDGFAQAVDKFVFGRVNEQ